MWPMGNIYVVFHMADYTGTGGGASGFQNTRSTPLMGVVRTSNPGPFHTVITGPSHPEILPEMPTLQSRGPPLPKKSHVGDT